MQVIHKDGAAERRVLTACIVSTDFLAQTAGKAGLEPFQSKWSNLIYRWCERHYGKYGSAPGRHIEILFEHWAERNPDKDLHKLVDRYLASLSGAYAKLAEDIDVAITIDLAEKHWNAVRAEQLKEAIQFRLDRGETDLAVKEIESFPKIDLRSKPAINVLRDRSLMQEALEGKQKILVKYPGAAGEFIGSELAEDSFVGIMAQVKGGKSFALLDIAWRAMRQGRQVAYFQVGDLSKNQILRRFLRRAANRPVEAGIARLPVSIAPPQDHRGLAVVEFGSKVYESDLNWRTAQRALDRIEKKSKGSIWLSYHPIKTVSAVDIKNILESWDKEGRVTDLCVIDYAWNLAPIDGKAGPVDQASYTWAMLRQISETRKCCVVTANQTKTEGFSSWILTRKHFADSKMILAAVTAFMGINMTEEEKQRGIIRWNWVVKREGDFSESRCLYLGSCLAVANPCVVSCLPR